MLPFDVLAAKPPKQILVCAKVSVKKGWKMLLTAGLGNLIPENLNFGGGFGLATILTVLFPYIEKVVIHLFDFDISAHISALFDPSTVVGKLLGGNSVLGASFGIVGVGAFIAFLQQIWNSVHNLYIDYFSISLEIPSSDSSYWEVLEWVHERQMKNPKHLSLQTETRQTPTGKWESQHDFVPSVGTHKFRYNFNNGQLPFVLP